MESLKFIQTLLSQSIKQIVPGRPALSANNLNIVWPVEIYEIAVNWNMWPLSILITCGDFRTTNATSKVDRV